MVAGQVLQPSKCLGWKDGNLQVPNQLICSCQEEQLAAANADDRAIDTTVDDTSDTVDRHEEFVASD